jgi:hypothetical protein
MAADPAQSYNVRVYVGDNTKVRDQIRVTVEGATPYTIASLAAGVFDTRTTAAGASASSDNVLTVTIEDLGGANEYWVINGIDIWETTAADPGVQALRAAGDVGSDGSAGAGALTAEALSPVVAQAIDLWAATGLSAEQVAALQSVQFTIVDFGSQDYLGLAVENRIQLDDDGAGAGWYTGAASEGPSAESRYDLLTVVLHELGHVLGYDDEEDSHDVMGERLMLGVRRWGDTEEDLLDLLVRDQAASAGELLQDDFFAELAQSE